MDEPFTTLETTVPETAGERRSARWARAATFVSLWLAVSGGVALLVSPSLSNQSIPELTAADVGKPFRAASPSGFKATRDYEIPDDARTKAARVQARATVKPVFDYDPRVRSAVLRDVEDAFARMQELAAREPLPADGARKKGDDAELLGKFRAERKALPAFAALDDSDFEALAQARFSRPVGGAVVSLLDEAYRNNIVLSREELSRVDARGIVVRVLGGSAESEIATAPPAVRDVSEVGLEFERLAAVPGSLLPDSAPFLRRAVLRFARRQLRPNLTINLAETEARRREAEEGVRPWVDVIGRGQRVIGDGELVTARHVNLLAAIRARTDQADVLWVQLGGAGVFSIATLVVFAFFRAFSRRFRPGRRDMTLVSLWGLASCAVLQGWLTLAEPFHDRWPDIPVEALPWLFPVAAGSMVIRMLLGERLAFFFAILSSIVSGVMVSNSLPFAVFTLVVSLLAVERVSTAQSPGHVFRAGLHTGVIAAALSLTLSLASGHGLSFESMVVSVFAALGCVGFAPPAVLVCVWALERMFGYASTLRLRALSSLNHPAMKRLIVEAPGTYHHSIVVGTLAEAGAVAIGANALLARTCAYYHDIGKGKTAAVHAENVKGENPHERLAPAMSALAVRRHIADGLELARQYRLPRVVRDAISQHHGTREVEFFARQARKAHEVENDGRPFDESPFRYSGPKPQSVEVALVMLANAVESSARTMSDPTPEKLEQLVTSLVQAVVAEGQLSECEFTTRDLAVVTQVFMKTLRAIHHLGEAAPPGGAEGAGPRLVFSREASKRVSAE